MANWSVLKAAIAEVIKANSNQEITGRILQNVLNNIVSSVGENSSFAGIATPDTNPGVPDGNAFYLAYEKGVYSNFGAGIELDGMTVKCIKKSASAEFGWTLLDLGIPSILYISILNGILGISNYENPEYTLTNDRYINTLGTVVVNSSYSITSPISLKKGQTIIARLFGSNIVAVISKYIDGTYHPLVLGLSVSEHLIYKYVSDEDCQIVISSLNNTFNKNNIYIIDSSFEEDILDILQREEELRKNLNSTGYEFTDTDSPISEQTGKYIAYDNGDVIELSSYSISEPITLQIGDIISFNGTANNVVAIIAKKNVDGTYTPILAGKGSTKEKYIYTVIADGDYVISSYNNIGLSNFTKASNLFNKTIINSFIGNKVVGTINKSGTTRLVINRLFNKGDIIELILEKEDDINASFVVNLKGFSQRGYGKFIYANVINDESDTINITVNSSVDNYTYTVLIKNREFEKAPISLYENRINSLNLKTKPILSYPSIESYTDIIVSTQEEFNVLNSNISSKIVGGEKALNIIFRNNTFLFNDENKIILSSINDTDVHLRFTCENSTIISDGEKFSRADKLGTKIGRNVFAYSTSFDWKDTFIADEEFIYPDINGDNEALIILGNIVKQEQEKTFKAEIPFSTNIDSDVIGKTILFTSWWEQVEGTITNIELGESNKYIYFTTNSTSPNADRNNYRLPALAKILNWESHGNTKTYYISGNRIYLPNAELVYKCSYSQFLNASHAHIGSIVLSNMCFGGSRNGNTPLIDVSDASNIFITGCEFKNIGNRCISNMTTNNGDVRNILIKDNIFYRCAGGCYLNANNTLIMNNRFVETGYYWHVLYPIYIKKGINFYIANNTIIDFTSSAIYIAGGTNLENGNNFGIVEYNDIFIENWNYNFAEHQLIDSGAIQISIVNYPVIVRYNAIDNYRTRKSGRGIMMGGNCSQISIYKNLITRIPSFCGIDFYAGTESNKYYPNGVENLAMYNVIQGNIRMVGGDDFDNTEYEGVYAKSNNDCVLGYNILGYSGYSLNDQVSPLFSSRIPYLENQLIDNSLVFSEKGHVKLSYDITNWDLPLFILEKLVLTNKVK